MSQWHQPCTGRDLTPCLTCVRNIENRKTPPDAMIHPIRPMVNGNSCKDFIEPVSFAGRSVSA